MSPDMAKCPCRETKSGQTPQRAITYYNAMNSKSMTSNRILLETKLQNHSTKRTVIETNETRINWQCYQVSKCKTETTTLIRPDTM